MWEGLIQRVQEYHHYIPVSAIYPSCSWDRHQRGRWSQLALLLSHCHWLQRTEGEWPLTDWGGGGGERKGGGGGGGGGRGEGEEEGGGGKRERERERERKWVSKWVRESGGGRGVHVYTERGWSEIFKWRMLLESAYLGEETFMGVIGLTAVVGVVSVSLAPPFREAVFSSCASSGVGDWSFVKSITIGRRGSTDGSESAEKWIESEN